MSKTSSIFEFIDFLCLKQNNIPINSDSPVNETKMTISHCNHLRDHNIVSWTIYCLIMIALTIWKNDIPKLKPQTVPAHAPNHMEMGRNTLFPLSVLNNCNNVTFNYNLMKTDNLIFTSLQIWHLKCFMVFSLFIIEKKSMKTVCFQSIHEKVGKNKSSIVCQR